MLCFHIYSCSRFFLSLAMMSSAVDPEPGLKEGAAVPLVPASGAVTATAA
jgi:hypothetical protein